ncbi:rhomboid family intramembrane serine protease [Thalassobacillus pellis]|uniref:rhomboid family intramembrane serine protease n=1 Tax=Thalassobacillus pellis TaxID=748008 RepID=UPI00196041D2|nr:rhomboid family intramembrane serine protease [Thalassobacillus pellis]MBM7554387.1 membrane associated rhomboid family serine protease [Thalassobacillus pellis]
MFIRTESFKEFIRSYPIVSTLVGIHLVLWLLIDLFQFGFALELRNAGVGLNIAVTQGEYWRLITPIFLHAGLGHAVFNSFSIVLFGPALEQMLGRFKFIILYLFAGFIGNLGTYLFNPDSFIPHLGASGAIFGIFGVYVFMVMYRKHLIDQANSQIVMVIFIIGLVMTFLRPNINILGHLCGFAGGFLIAPFVLKNAERFSVWRNTRSNRSDIGFDPNRWSKRRFPLKKVLTYVLWGGIIALVAIGLLGNFF